MDSSTPLFVTGGRQRDRKTDEWHQFDKAVLLHVDPKAETGKTALEHETASGLCPAAEPCHIFKAATRVGDELFLCSSTEVLVYGLPEFDQRAHVSLPCFNDLHHAQPSNRGTILVANTGLDMVVEVTREGELVDQWSVTGEDTWERFDQTIDYRLVSTTKPHQSHPNFVFQIGDEVWASRFAQSDAISLSSPGRSVSFGHKPHDGVLVDGLLHFTTIDGHVFIVDPKTLEIVRDVDLYSIDDRKVDLGWCRGILPMGNGLCWVGFSRLRPTKFRENLSWLRHGFKRFYMPTRIALYDLEQGCLVSELDLEPFGLNAVFSILSAAPFPADAPDHQAQSPQTGVAG